MTAAHIDWDRLIALHDLDCSWRSADVEQRLDRIRRQGSRAIGIELIGLYAWHWEGTKMRSHWHGAPGFMDRFPLGGSLLLGFDGDDDPRLGLGAHFPWKPSPSRTTAPSAPNSGHGPEISRLGEAFNWHFVGAFIPTPP